MIALEILSSYRSQLTTCVATHEPATPRPVSLSPWVASALLQKSIRRGRKDLALLAAATLMEIAPERVWRRVACIAWEDIGLAGLESVGYVTASLGGKRIRAEMGGEWRVASFLVHQMAEAHKCRAADDLLMKCALHPSLTAVRRELGQVSTKELLQVVSGSGPLPERALALWYAIGTERGYFHTLEPRRGEPAVAFDYLYEAGCPYSIVELAREGYRRTGELLAPLVALMTSELCKGKTLVSDDETPPEIMIGDVPGWTYDVYSREGRAALRLFLEGEAASARWIREQVPRPQRIAVFGHAVFRVEGQCVRNRLRWPTADRLQEVVDRECAGPACLDVSELLHLVRADIPQLNVARLQLNGRLSNGQ